MKSKIILMIAVLILASINLAFGYTAPSYNAINQQLCIGYTPPLYNNIDSRLSACVTDTCTYSGTGNWDIDCADNCVETIAINVQGDIIFTGNGRFTATAPIRWTGSLRSTDWCEVKFLNQ